MSIEGGARSPLGAGSGPIGVEQSSFLAVLSWYILVTCPYQHSHNVSHRKKNICLTLSNMVKPLIFPKNLISAA